MISITKSKKRIVYFAVKPKETFLKPIVFVQAKEKIHVFGYKRESFYTKIIRLNNELEEMHSFTRNTRNEIRKATREGVLFFVESDILLFVNFYNDFARSLSLNTIKEEDLMIYGSNLVITKAVMDGKVLTMHSYFFDNEVKRVRLLHSASLHKNIKDKKERAQIGRSNRFLHFKDMEYFFNKGFKIYDLGGYAYNTTDKHMQNINKFKDSFGGELEENYNYIPIWLYLAGKIKRLFK